MLLKLLEITDEVNPIAKGIITNIIKVLIENLLFLWNNKLPPVIITNNKIKLNIPIIIDKSTIASLYIYEEIERVTTIHQREI